MKTSVLRSSIGLLKGPTGTIQKSRETGAISRTAQAVVPHKDWRCHNPNQAWAPLQLETGFASTKRLPGFCSDAFVLRWTLLLDSVWRPSN